MIKRIAIAVIASGLLVQASVGDVWQDLARYEYGDESNAGEAVEKVLEETPVNEYGRLEKGLIGVVTSKDATQAGKAIACRMLQQVGTEACIPALSNLLGDEILSHYARLVLERLSCEKANQAMRDALEQTPDGVKIGILGSLGEVRDAKAVASAGKLARSGKPDVAEAAIHALGKIGGSQAAQTLASLKPARVLVPVQMQAMVACAASLQGDEAAALCETVLAGTFSPARIAALRALASADAAKAAPRIARAVKGDDLALGKGALGIVAETKGEVLTKAMVDLLGDLSPERKAGLVLALGSRGDKAALAGLTALIRSEAAVVRDAAITAVSKLGDAGTVRTLLAMADSDALRTQVAKAIARMTAEKIDEALAAALEEAALRKAAIEASIARGSEAVVPGLLKLVKQSDADARKDAWTGLASLAGADHMDAIMKALVELKAAEERSGAEDAVKKIIARAQDKAKCFQTIAGYYDRATDATKGVILGLGAASGDAAALEMERKALASGDKALYGQALRALAAWPNASAGKDLLSLAKGAPEKVDRLVALRGYIRIAGLDTAGLNDNERTAMFKTAMELAERTEEKKQILSGLQNVRTGEALDMLKTCMDDPALQAEAELAAANLIWELRSSHAAEATAMAKRLLQSKNKAVADRATATIADLSKTQIYVRAWLVSDVYRVKDKGGDAVHKTAFPPEKGDSGVTWKRLKKGGGKESTDLEKAVGRMQRCCVYVKTTLVAPSEQAARLEFGSDDGIKAWLNGTLVHDFWGKRGCTPGQDVAKVRLNKGPNVLLLKITNEDTHWAFSCRVRQEDGMPVEGLQVKPQ